MFIYIYLVMQEMVIHCADSIGCISVSASHFTHLLEIGALELIFEFPMAIRIFKLSKKFTKEQEEKDKEQNGK